MADRYVITLEFNLESKDIKAMGKSLRKVAKDPTDPSIDAKDANALLYTADLLDEIAQQMR
mgnify:CR=1 FL=1